jgi:21S rRNA (GM2251-2'-O)-methyltransferase
VEAALKDSRRQLYKLYIYSGDDRRNVAQDDALEQLARRKGVDVTKVPNNGLRMMDKMSGGRPHNGCVLEASPLPQLPLKALGPLSEDPAKPGFYVDMAHQSSEEAKVNGTTNFINYQLPKERKPFILLLDGILDPGNLGAILRTAAFLGVNGIAITRDSSATLTAVALKASAGASEVATLFSVSSTVDFLTRSKENGWSVYAAVPSTKRSRGNSHLTVDRVETYDPLSSQPTVLVIGSEGEGLSKPVRRLADHEVSIPSPSGGFLSVVDSLNVSVATGILCTAFLKKQSSGMIEIEEELLESKRENNPVLW